MNVGSIVEYYLCDYCLNGDNSLYSECFDCVKKQRNGMVSAKNMAASALGYPKNHPELKGKQVSKVYDFETGKTPTIMDDDLRVICDNSNKANRKP